VKLAEFDALCVREWDEARGDVTGLNLTDDSRQELVSDLLATGAHDSAAMSAILNPVTRTAVKITGGASTDSAEVRRYCAECPHPAGIPCT
jgi:hypothetical protein